MYWRFLTIGARYCTHSFADCSAPSRDAACIAPQRKVIGSAKLLIADDAGERALRRLVDVDEVWNAVGAMCSVCLMSSRLWSSAVRHRCQFVRRRAQRFAVVGDEASDVTDDIVEVFDRVGDLIGVVGEQRRSPTPGFR